jgi:hypothetical protein
MHAPTTLPPSSQSKPDSSMQPSQAEDWLVKYRVIPDAQSLYLSHSK